MLTSVKYFVVIAVFHLMSSCQCGSVRRVTRSTCSDGTHCISMSLCPEVKDKYESGIAPRICGWVFEGSNVAKVCCPRNATTGSKQSCGVRKIPPPEENIVFFADREIDIDEEDDFAPDEVTDEPLHHLVVGGEKAQIKWPWMAGISYKIIKDSLFCGGTLIDERHVLTAAHCFDDESMDPKTYSILVGDLILSENNHFHDVEEIILHEDYKAPYYYDDIAILRLTKPVSADAMPVCLPTVDDVKDGQNLTILGWGDLYYGGDGATHLQEAHGLPVVNQKECNDFFRRRAKARFPKGIWDKFLCAGLKEGGKDSCQRDSGGPLLRQESEEAWSLVGIISFGIRCAEPGYPGVYTRVASYMPWIAQHVKNVPK